MPDIYPENQSQTTFGLWKQEKNLKLELQTVETIKMLNRVSRRQEVPRTFCKFRISPPTAKKLCTNKTSTKMGTKLVKVEVLVTRVGRKSASKVLA